MIRLNQTASQLLSLVTAQNGATVVVSYSDKSATGYDGNTQVTAISSATTTTICNTPAASTIRDVDHISVRNTYIGSQSVTIQLSSSATLYPLVTVSLAQGDSIEYTHGSGWQVLDSTGQIKFALASIPVTGITGLGTGVATALAVNVGSAGAPVVFNGALGTPSSGTVTNLTGTASININGTVGATTPNTGAFTTLSATGNITASSKVNVGSPANTARQVNIGGAQYPSMALLSTAIAGAAGGGQLYFGNATTPGEAYLAYDNATTTFQFNKPLAVTGAITSTTTIKSGGYTVATLPAGTAGMRAYVTDATTPTWLAALTGGGAVVAPVFHNGTAWLSA